MAVSRGSRGAKKWDFRWKSWVSVTETERSKWLPLHAYLTHAVRAKPPALQYFVPTTVYEQAKDFSAIADDYSR